MFADQLACADLVILNKTDLIDPARLAPLSREIEARLRPGVKLVGARATGGRRPRWRSGLAAAAEDDLAARPSLHELEGGHDHDDFESFVVIRGAVADGDAFLARLRAAIGAHDVLRVKGFVDRARPRPPAGRAGGRRSDAALFRPALAGRRDRARRGSS